MSDPIVILVTGSRNWTEQGTFLEAMEMIRRQHPDTGRWIVRHGACPAGPDQLADMWAYRSKIERDPMPANWGAHGRRAGITRNQEMVSKSPVPSVCLAFLAECIKKGCQKPKPHGSHGATDCAERAEAVGIPTWRWRQGW